jgi:predicted nucleic acid-binding protein
VILLDTTVLVYALGRDHPYRDPCRALIGAVADGDVPATTTVEAIQEFVHVRARRRGRADAAELGRDYAALLSPLLEPDVGDLRDGLTLFERQSVLGAFDAVLAAAAVNAGVQALVSADTAFAAVPGLTHVVPDREGVSGLLAS